MQVTHLRQCEVQLGLQCSIGLQGLRLERAHKTVVADYLLFVSGHRFAVQSLPLRSSHPQFDVLLLGNRYENLGKWRWGYVSAGIAGGGFGGG